jgi:DNA gyrase/topoisomerase IV subunit B
MYALCPEFVEAGKLFVVTPPYYKIQYKKGDKDKAHYIKDYNDLVLWFCDHVYRPTFNIKLGHVHPNPKNLNKRVETIHDLNDHPEVFDAFMRNILTFGEILINLSQELMINALILEKLTYISYYLDVHTVDPIAIKHILCADDVRYDDVGHIITLTYGRDDYVIPLFKVKERLTDELLPLLNRMRWKDLRLYITAKRYNGLKDQVMSLGEFYSLLKGFEKDFKIEKLKGLGTMEPQDTYQTCMDPRYRTMYQITSVKDVNLIWDLLGKNSDKRKNLLIDQTIRI